MRLAGPGLTLSNIPWHGQHRTRPCKKRKSGSISWLPNYNNPSNNQYASGWNGVSYDGRGDMTEDTFGNTFTWSAYGGMASVNGSSITYDALGRMVANSGGTQQFVYSPAGGQPLAAMNGQTPNDIYVPLPGGAFAMYNSTGLFQYNHPDWRGSAVLLSTPTQTQGNTPYYAPFGEGYAQPGWVQFTSAGNPWTLVDGSQNDGSTLDDFMYRRYSATQGRWISPDPAGLAAVDPTSPQSWNRYAYAMNNPLSYVDPTGLDCVRDNGDGTTTTYTDDQDSCDGDNGFYFDGTVDPSSAIVDDKTGNVWASVNGGALTCSGDSSCPQTESITVNGGYAPQVNYLGPIFGGVQQGPVIPSLTRGPAPPSR
jgi:RHS repeat-associated protein